MSAKPLIKFEKVKVSLGKKRDFVIKDINFEIFEGRSLVIFGPNGSGKSTILKLIAGLKNNDSGNILHHCSPQEIGYIPQHMGLLPMLSVRKNILLGALNRVSFFKALFGFSAVEMDDADKIMRELGLYGKAGRKVSTLSGGERRRVAIARALMQRPKLLLADEILSNLDFKNARKITEMLKDLKNKYGLTLVIVEHDMCTAKEFAETIILLKNGKIIERKL